jgi:putative peptidoglycan lipid II flippase
MAHPSNGQESSAAARVTRSSNAASVLVGAGILISRIVGLVRERVLATYFGTELHADVFSAGLRMPNLLQNLLGEGTLSASFIPVYSELIGQGRTQEAGRVAGALFALLLGIAGIIAMLGILFAPFIVSVFTPGFEGQRRTLAVAVVKIIFPMTGVLVLSAWALGILNSHRKFFIPYFAPVLWNAAIIAVLVGFGARLELDALLIATAWGALLGGFLQFGIQIPWVLRLNREIRVNSGRREPGFKEIVRNAGPAILGRGIVQLSTYLDLILASLLAVGALARLRYAQTLYLLPISLFGMSIAAAELPELARERSRPNEALRERMRTAIQHVAFYVVPSCVAFVLLGDVLVAGLYRAGAFGATDVTIVWLILAAYSIGLLASTSTRIYQSAFFALHDTKTPARVAGLRVLTAGIAGALLMVQFESVTVGGITVSAGVFEHLSVAGIPLGPVGLALGASGGAWIEWWLLRAALISHIGRVDSNAGLLARLFAAALAAAAAGHGTRVLLEDLHPLLLALLVTATFGVVYFCAAWTLGLSEARVVFASVLRRRL